MCGALAPRRGFGVSTGEEGVGVRACLVLTSALPTRWVATRLSSAAAFVWKFTPSASSVTQRRSEKCFKSSPPAPGKRINWRVIVCGTRANTVWNSAASCGRRRRTRALRHTDALDAARSQAQARRCESSLTRPRTPS